MDEIKSANDWLKSQVEAYCYMVSRGKPAAVLAIQNRYSVEINSIVKSFQGLKTYEQFLSEGWISLWIYKKDFMLEIIKSLPEEPKTIYDHWVLGKVFGYSDEAIEEFIRN
jgi:spore cortex formation protein SpoVR/YcgB (stage V sporulation)